MENFTENWIKGFKVLWPWYFLVAIGTIFFYGTPWFSLGLGMLIFAFIMHVVAALIF